MTLEQLQRNQHCFSVDGKRTTSYCRRKTNLAAVRVSMNRGKNSEDKGAKNEETKQKEKGQVFNGARAVTADGGDGWPKQRIRFGEERLGGSGDSLERRGWAAAETVDEGSCWVEDSLLGSLELSIGGGGQWSGLL
ncbi:shaggy-related protein kinase theta [Striga asiatica]|uniref:Shaggy-related protein kinase theta n=1 Tax=Striga asiatica TaxID=4170 RepID=A0A5A7QCJ3_STRAF|nr:shaggy-related protein kinase theta [Striga asiatica]